MLRGFSFLIGGGYGWLWVRQRRLRFELSGNTGRLGWNMDTIEAKRNLEVLERNRSRLMNYNHLYSSYAFKEMCGAELRKVNKQIHGIEEQLNAQPQKTRSNQKAAMHSVR